MSSIKKRGDSWYGRVEVGCDPVSGRRRQRAFSARTKKDVIDRIAELKTTINKGQYVPPTKQTVAEWFDEWFETVVKPHKSIRTVETYKNVLENHLEASHGREEAPRPHADGRHQVPCQQARRAHCPNTKGRRQNKFPFSRRSDGVVPFG